MMFNFLLRKWKEEDSKITIADIDHAITERWITAEDGKIIKETSREGSEG